MKVIIKVVVTRAKRAKIHIPTCNTLIGGNSGSIEDRAMKFACNMVFLAVADQMVEPSSLSRDRK